MAVDETCPVCMTAEIVCGKWTLLLIRDLAEGCSRFCELERSLAGHQPAHAVAAPAGARGGGHRRAPHLPRGAAARRVRADREGPRAAADHRRHARLRRRLAGGRVRRAIGRRLAARRGRRRADARGRIAAPAGTAQAARQGAPGGAHRASANSAHHAIDSRCRRRSLSSSRRPRVICTPRSARVPRCRSSSRRSGRAGEREPRRCTATAR